MNYEKILYVPYDIHAGSMFPTESRKQKMNDRQHDPAKEMNILTEEEIAAGWQLLFDGTSTKGWRGFKKEKFPDQAGR